MDKLIITACMLFFGLGLCAQTTISMEQAIEQITTKHPTILQQELYIEQQQILKAAGKQQPFLGFGYSFEEVGITGSGIHSLYLQQTFNMPKVAKSKALYREEMSKTGAFQKEATAKELERYIASVYQQILFLKSKKRVTDELLLLYKNIEDIASKRAAVGETGELPIFATQTAQQQLQLQQMRTEQKYLAQLEKLKQFLMDNSITDISDTVLVALPNKLQEIDVDAHPLVKTINQKIVANNAQNLVIQSQLLPQISVGFQTQVVQGAYPFFGGQFGFNVPLFKKGVKAQIKANKLNSAILKENKNWQVQQLNTQQKIAIQNIKQLQAQLQHIETVILPTLEKQQEFSQKAYAIGELDYLNVLQSLQQIIAAKNSYLQVLFQLNLAWVDYEYLVID